jgi:hypothetical protein
VVRPHHKACTIRLVLKCLSHALLFKLNVESRCNDRARDYALAGFKTPDYEQATYVCFLTGCEVASIVIRDKDTARALIS